MTSRSKRILRYFKGAAFFGVLLPVVSVSVYIIIGTLYAALVSLAGLSLEAAVLATIAFAGVVLGLFDTWVEEQ